MIVRNEEARLAACLASVKGFADEMVLVDTGSVDATVAIAKTPAAHTGAFFTKCNEGDITDSVVVRYAGGASVSERAQPVSPPRPHPEPWAEAAAATP